MTGDIALVGVRPGLSAAPARRRAFGAARAHARGRRAAARAQALFPDGGVTLRRAAPTRATPSCRRAGAPAGAVGARSRPRRRAATPACAHPRRGRPAAPSAARAHRAGPRAHRGRRSGALVRARAWLAEWQPALDERLASVPDAFEATGAAGAARGGAAAERAACRRRLADHPADRGADRDRRQRRRPAGRSRPTSRRPREIARQLRLRRIGGTVVVDFIDLPTRAARARVPGGPARRARRRSRRRCRCFRCRASAWSR